MYGRLGVCVQYTHASTSIFLEDQMNVERDVDDENDGETLGRTGNV